MEEEMEKEKPRDEIIEGIKQARVEMPKDLPEQVQKRSFYETNQKPLFLLLFFTSLVNAGCFILLIL